MTAEEFIALLEVDKQSVHEVLRPQIHPEILKFLIGGVFDNSRKRLVAYALMRVNKDYFWKYDYILKFSEGHVAVLFNLKEDQKKPTGIYPPGKSIKEEIEDGHYKNNLISFVCEYDFDEWNILRSNCFTDTKDQIKTIGSALDNWKGSIEGHFFATSTFEETSKHFENINKYTTRAIKIDVSPEMRPFIGHSFLVALVRTNRKREVNWAYIDYIQKAIFQPLAIKLKAFFPNKYYQIDPFSHTQQDLLYPENRRFCLFICISIDSSKKKRLSFFVYQQENNVVYEWIYFPESTYRKYKLAPHELPQIFSPISKLDTWEYLINPECTFDDDEFWNNYVFKKENGKYVYLKELKFD